jgi:hypothetical protein
VIKKKKVLKENLQTKESAMIDILNYIKWLDSFLNTCTTYKILLTIHVTNFFFSKLKLIKSYLRSTMSQEKLRISHIITWK